MADIELMHHLAELSGIRFSTVELEKMRTEMADVMVLMDKVKDAPKNGAANQQSQTDYTHLRNDTVQASNPEAIEFTVPNIVG